MKQHSLPFLLLLAHRPIIRSRFHCKKMTLREIDSIENWKLTNQFLYCLQPPLINTKQEVVEKSSNFMTFIIYQRQVRALRLFFQLFTLLEVPRANGDSLLRGSHTTRSQAYIH